MEKNKRYKKGFVLGKFMPPHLGHLHLIQRAMEQVDELTVLVCSIQKEPIPGELRFAWMQQLAPDCNVIHVTDEVPSYPHEKQNFSVIWTALLKREIHPDTEVFFSSEDYGNDVANWLTIEHVLIDLERKEVPISATEIRVNPFKNWQFIPEIVQPYFVKRIVLTGPESTGKTTLAKKLAEHFETTWVEEFGRSYFVEKGGVLQLIDIQHIANGQVDLEEQNIQKATKLVFCDTDLIVTQIWSEIYFQECPETVIEMSYQRKYDLYLLLDIDIPWEDDGTREFPHLRQWHYDRIQLELENRGLKYAIISGNFDERLKSCIKAVHSII